MEDWIRSNFECFEFDGDTYFKFNNGNVEVEANLGIFLSIFGHVEVPPTFDTLIDVDPENNTGWHKHFEAWKQQGILN